MSGMSAKKWTFKKLLITLGSATAILGSAFASTTGIVVHFSNALSSIINKTGIKFDFGDSSIVQLTKNRPSLLTNDGKISAGTYYKVRVKKIDWTNNIWKESDFKNGKSSKLKLDWELNLQAENEPDGRSPMGSEILFTDQSAMFDRTKIYAWFRIGTVMPADENVSVVYNSFLSEKIIAGDYNLRIFKEVSVKSSDGVEKSKYNQMVLNKKLKIKNHKIPKGLRVKNITSNYTVKFSPGANLFGFNLCGIQVESSDKKLLPEKSNSIWDQIFGGNKDLKEVGIMIKNAQGKIVWTTVTSFEFNGFGFNSDGKWNWDYLPIAIPEEYVQSDDNNNDYSFYFTFNQTGTTVKGVNQNEN